MTETQKPKLTKAEAARLNGRKGTRPRKPASQRAIQSPAIENPFKLSPRELLFVEAYSGAAQFQAGPAYQLTGFKGKPATARVLGSRMLTRDHVQRALAQKLAQRVERLKLMDGDEALERLSLYGRADIGKVLDPNDPLAKLPDEVRLCIKSVRPNQFGRVIELHDAMHAAEVLAKVAGKLVDKHEHVIKLEEIIARANRPRAVA